LGARLNPIPLRIATSCVPLAALQTAVQFIRERDMSKDIWIEKNNGVYRTTLTDIDEAGIARSFKVR
jgi:hypothetical protein